MPGPTYKQLVEAVDGARLQIGDTMIVRLPSERPKVNIMQACALAGVSRRTIYSWMGAGRLEYVRTAGGSVRIFTDSLFREGARRPRP